jgi:hypothetical protein
LIKAENYKMTHQILSQYGDYIRADLIDAVLSEIFEHTEVSACEDFSDPNVDLNVLLRYVREKWPERYQQLLTDYY